MIPWSQRNKTKRTYKNNVDMIRHEKCKDKRQKIKLILLFFAITISSMLELIGVSAIMPLASIATDPNQINDKKLYIVIGKMMNLQTAKEFVLFFAIFLIIVYILKNLYICLLNYYMIKFTFNNRAHTSIELLNYYINQEYIYIFFSDFSFGTVLLTQ